MFRVFQVLALLTLFFASSGRAAVVSQTAPNPAATSGVFLPLPALETTGAYEDAPPTGLEPRIGLLCHNDPVNNVDPDGQFVMAIPLIYWGIAAVVGTTAVVVTTNPDARRATADAARAIGREIPRFSWRPGVGWMVNSNQAAGPADPPKSKAPPANQGVGPKHGGDAHDGAIEDDIAAAQAQGAKNIRKNQAQTDVNGDKVGDNRPDTQYDLNGVHVNVERDTTAAGSLRHQRVLPANDPNAVNRFLRVP